MAAKNYLEFHVNGKAYDIKDMQTKQFAPDAKVTVYYVGLKKVFNAQFYYKQMFLCRK